MNKKTIIYITIFSVAFSLRLFLAFNYRTQLVGDEGTYNKLAELLVSTGRYCDEKETYSYPPAYPFFISIVYFLFGCKTIAVRIIQALLDSLMPILIFKLCYRQFNRIAAFITSIAYIVYPLFIKATSRILTESIFTFFLFLTVYYLYNTRERLNYRNMFIVGILVTVLVLIKGIVLLFLPFLFLSLLLSNFYYPSTPSDVTKKFIIAFITFILFMSFWTYRNYRVFHAFVPVSTQGGYALYDCYFPKDGKIFGVNVLDENVQYAMSLNSQTQMSQYLTAKTIEFIKAHPFKVLRLGILKFLYFWVPFDWEIMDIGKGIYNYQYMFMLPFSILGMFLLLKEFNRFVLLYFLIAYFLFMSLIFYGSPRFRMPIEPYLIIFFSVGILKFFNEFKKKFMPVIFVVVYFFINFVMYLNTDMVKSIFRKATTYVGLW